jgi:hypothetical protein
MIQKLPTCPTFAKEVTASMQLGAVSKMKTHESKYLSSIGTAKT